MELIKRYFPTFLREECGYFLLFGFFPDLMNNLRNLMELNTLSNLK